MKACAKKKIVGSSAVLVAMIYLSSCPVSAAATSDAKRASAARFHAGTAAKTEAATGDALVDRLNAAQLGSAYQGPVYYRGQAIPPATALTIRSDGTVAAPSADTENLAETAEIDRLNDAQTGRNYQGPVYYAGQKIPKAQPVRINRNVPVAPLAPAGRDANGDQEVDSLNAAQLDGAYKGPVYYPGQPIPAARPVASGTLRGAGPVAGATVSTAPPAAVATSAAARAPVTAPETGQETGLDKYSGALYRAPGAPSLPPPSPVVK